jgi:predicted Zn-dependent protease
MIIKKGNYASAETNYEKILETEPNNSKTMVFLAVSYLNTDKPEKAIDLLSKYVPEGSRYDEDIQWYLALAYLKTEQKGTAKLLLEGLRDKKGFYKDQSALILSKL